MSSPLFICADAGGTKVACAIANSKGDVIARGRAGSGNMAEIGLQNSFNEIRLAIMQAIIALPADYLPENIKESIFGVPALGGPEKCPIEFAGAWVGISGCDSALDSRRMSVPLTLFFGIPVTAMNDALLLSGPILAHHSPWGIAVVAGTGSVVCGVKMVDVPTTMEGESGKKGKKPELFARRGGHGFLLGDEGSAYHMGRTAIVMAANDATSGLEKPGPLVTAIKEAYKAAATEDVPSHAHMLGAELDAIAASNARKLKMASLAIPVIASANLSPPDPLAMRIVVHCAKEVAEDIVQIAKLGEERCGGKPSAATLSFTGGLIAQKVYQDAVLAACADRGVVFGNVHQVEDAAGSGAAALALDASL